MFKLTELSKRGNHLTHVLQKELHRGRCLRRLRRRRPCSCCWCLLLPAAPRVFRRHHRARAFPLCRRPYTSVDRGREPLNRCP